jgi:hemolysin III
MNASAKPRFRGVSHQFAFFLALIATALLVSWTPPGAHAKVALVFGAGLSLLFGISALYHRIDWSPRARQRMRSMDHSAIFVLIAAGYTPLFGLVPGSHGGHRALVVVWLGALVGTIKSIAWPSAPKWLTATLAVAMGWLVVGEVMDRTATVGALCIGFLVASGIVYSLGAVVYARRRPDPLPAIFGYHEVFHAIVIGASVCLFTHVVLVLRAV